MILSWCSCLLHEYAGVWLLAYWEGLILEAWKYYDFIAS